MYENLKSTANEVSNNLSSSLGSFKIGVTPLQTVTAASLVPFSQQSNLLKTLNKNSNINQNYSEFNSNTGFNLSKAINDKYKPQLINENITEYLPTQQGYNNKIEPIDTTKISTTKVTTDVNKTPTIDTTNRPQTNNNKIGKYDLNADGKTSLNEFSQSTAGQITSAAANIVGGFVNQLGNSVGAYSDRSEAQKLNDTQEAIRSASYSAVSMIPGVGPFISAGLQAIDGIGKMAGTQMSNISKDAAEDAGLSRGWNNVVATIPGIGSLLGGLAKKTDEFNIDRSRLDNVSSAYDMSTFDSAEDLSEGKFLGQSAKVNSFIRKQKNLRDKMTNIASTQDLRKQGASAMAANYLNQNQFKYSGNINNMIIGKKGMKISNIEWAKQVLQKFQKGGKLGIDVNVIVEGSYHAHNNHLNEVNPELQDVTPKGIPVTLTDESGNKQQVAEIERKELILTKDLTDKLESLYKDGSDEAAIKAGILFAEELFNNTEDNTGEVLNENN